MIEWKRKKCDGMMIYFGKHEYSTYEIRSWPYDESGEGRYQLCVDDYHKGHCKTLAECKDWAERGY